MFGENCSANSNSMTPWDCSLPGSSIHEILHVRILEWVAISFFRVSSQPRDQTQVSCIAGGFFTFWATRILEWLAYSFSRRSSWPRNQTRVSCIAGGFFTSWATREAPSYGIPHNKINSGWIKESHLGKPNEDVGEYLISGCGKPF